jgi:hypothetical protein
MSNDFQYFCPRCQFELEAVVTNKKVGDKYAFGDKLNLSCDNCDWVWRGEPAHSPVVGKLRVEDE